MIPPTITPPRLVTPTATNLTEHLRRHGPLPPLAPAAFLTQVDTSGLLGRGGAGFPTGRKMRAVAAGTGPAVVVGNGCEGEPASSKDALLLERSPHLVLDGLQAAASAVGADQIHLMVHAGAATLTHAQHALTERRTAGLDRVPVQLHALPARYVSSEESALVNYLNGGPAKPTFTPPRPYEKGVAKRPTLINNVETLAHLGLIARHGGDWFRSVGDPQEPGTQLLSIAGPGARQRVLEVETGTTVEEAFTLAGVDPDACQAVLIGGYFGTWHQTPHARPLPLTHHALRAAGGALGAGIVIGLPRDRCGLVETARVATYLAAHNAGQCGPCLNGLPAIATALAKLAHGPWQEETGVALNRWLTLLPGRGACRHPDGATRLITSALHTFAADVTRHRQGIPCAGATNTAWLPIPNTAIARGPWR